MVDWKKAYEELAKLCKRLNDAPARDFSNYLGTVMHHIQWYDKQALRDDGKIKVYRVKEDITVNTIYEGKIEKPVLYKAGQLVESLIIYLDEDGDGTIYFPADKMEEVIVSLDDAQDVLTGG